MVKRGVWIVACIIGVIVQGGLAVLMAYGIFFDPETGGASFTLRGIAWPILLILGAGACAAGIFMSPREFQEATKVDVDEEPAQWIKDMRTQQNEPAQRQTDE